MNSDSKRVTKNTIMLYGRMVVVMFIGMWTSRLVLNALGFTDQGLYNVVGGFVGFLNLVSGSVSVSISRYITYEIGRDNSEGVSRAYGNAITVQLLLALIVLALAESVGLWYVNSKLVVPPDRLVAVNFVYQFSILSFITTIFTVSPMALVIAHEKMNIFAYASIGNSLGAFANALVITFYGYDRLILYSFLQLCVPLAIYIFYRIYCAHTFPACRYRPRRDKEVFKPMFSFAGWNMIGSSAGIIRISGTSVLLNFFGGPIANTINGISNQVNILASMFVNDFTTAFTPQITKKYAAAEYSRLVSFLHSCSKFSYCLLLIVAVPVFLHIDTLLVLWLKNIPSGTVVFARLIIIYTAFECISKPLITAKNATGDIRNYQIVVGGILLLTIPLSYLFLKIGFPLWYAYLSLIITAASAFAARMVMLQGAIPGWNSWNFIKGPFLRCLLATVFSLSLPLVLLWFCPESLPSVLSQCVVGFLWGLVCVLFIGCTADERKMAYGMIDKFKKKLRLSV